MAIEVFISSKQSELEAERMVLADKLRSLPFLEPVLAQEWPPARAAIRDVFLQRVRQAPIYVGLFHRIYSEPTEAEYREALTNSHREVLIYQKTTSEPPDAELQRLLNEMNSAHVIYRFGHVGELLPLFAGHIGAALGRLVALAQGLGEPPPASRGGATSVLRNLWGKKLEQRRAILAGLGLTIDSQAELTSTLQMLHAAQAAAAARIPQQ